ncbi:MAG: M28 family peptidase [Bryobacteraceae bacterium]
MRLRSVVPSLERRSRATILFFSAIIVFAQDVSPERLRAHVRFLSSDLLEGRGPGERGGELATEYLASQLAVAGAKPAGENGTWFQAVPLVGVKTAAGSRLSVGGIDLRWLDEFVGQNQTQRAHESIDAEAVFAGHGISAPEFGWDDYAGADVKGKAVVLFTNEPPSTDPRFFGGPALTYYGRWTYKFEEATRRGAAAVLILHTTETAGYGWNVVRNSWGQEDLQVNATGTPLAFAGWLSGDASTKLAEKAGTTVEALLRKAGTRGFRVVPLGFRVNAEVRSELREIRVRNVVGQIRGSDPTLDHETAAFSAHWDHLGMRKDGEGDRIFNGAVDNATGCAVVLEIARLWSHLGVKPRRSALFLFTAAEEAGLRGAEYWVTHPLVPLADTSLVLNFDSFFPFGRTQDVVLDGAERASSWPQIQMVARRMGLRISPEARPEQGTFFRSDHFAFAKAGVAAFSVKAGQSFSAGGEENLLRLKEYHEKHYHQASDEYSPEWDFSGMEQVARFGMALGSDAANWDRKVRWNTPAQSSAAKPAPRTVARKRRR